jgi:lysozyme
MASVNAAGLDLIKSFEGCELTAYQDSGGIWTIGYGHTGPGVEPGVTITQAQADAFLASDVKYAEGVVADSVEIALTPNQFSALVSFEYNTGSLPGSTMLKLLNSNDIAGAAAQFDNWVYADVGGNEVKLDGLVRRRAAEKALFLNEAGPPNFTNITGEPNNPNDQPGNEPIQTPPGGGAA